MSLLPYILALFTFCSVASADSLNVAIIGDDYVSQDNFRNDAEEVAANIVEYEPYKTYRNQISFIIVPNQEDLQCAPSPNLLRLVTCNNLVVRNKLIALGITYDWVLIIWNNPYHYGGSGGQYAVVYNGSSMVEMAVHELFGHGAGLVDEYILYATNCAEQDTALANCWKQEKAGWYKGCYCSNYYRQTDCSIMKSLSCKYFNQVSIDYITNRLNYYTGGLKPTPDVTLTASPLEGRVPLTVTFTVVASGDGELSYEWRF